MSDERNRGVFQRPRWDWKELLFMAVEIAALSVALWFKPVAHLGFAELDTRHPWIEVIPVVLVFGLLRWVYVRFINRERTRQTWAATLQEMRTNPPKRMSLVGRTLVLLFGLALVVAGSLIPGRDGSALLV